MTLQYVAEKRPELVSFFQPPTDADIAEFERVIGATIPNSLKIFWLRWGTGSVFETEEFFSPAEDLDTGESALTLINEYRAIGLPNEFFVFHRGLGGVTCMNSFGTIVQINDTDSSIKKQFATIDEWFDDVLMREYANRYSLE